MVNRLNRCTSNLTSTPSSSCTEYLSHPCQGGCNNERCKRSCYFINDHTYTILKKICRRMIKDYTRSQCREKYKIFDGGNSINVRVHRSDSQGNRACRPEDRQRQTNQRCHSVSTDQKQQRLSSEKDGRVGGKFGANDDDSFRRKGRGKLDKTDKGQTAKQRDDVDNFGNDRNGKKGKRKSSTGGGKDDVDNDEKRLKGKAKGSKKDGKGYDNDNDDNEKGKKEKGKGKDSKRANKGDNENDDKEQKEKRRSKRDSGGNNNDDIDVNKSGKRRKEKRNDNDSDTDIKNDKSKKGEKGTKKRKSNKNDDYDDEDGAGAAGKKGAAKGKGNKGKSKDADYEQDDDRGNKKGVSKEEKRKSKEGTIEKKMKGRKSKGDDIDYDEERNSKGKKAKQSKSKNDNDADADDENNRRGKGKGKKNRASVLSNDRVISDLRKKVRKGDKVGPDEGRLSKNKSGLSEERGRKSVRLIKQEAEALQYRQLKSTRADEAKACDYLRANMEQRDLCLLVCPPQPCRLQQLSCNPCARMPCLYPNSCFPACPETYCKC